MEASEKLLAEQLKEAGTRLLSPPSSVDRLLPLLDEVESCLERVEQSPSKTMQDALSPSMKALIAHELLGHTDPDVKVSVATCISEITRITAPDAPYNDDQMKEIFQLIVSSFEKLYDKSSRSYNKRTTILETVAKVRSCVVMLDLECDALILEMFQHFLKSIRDYHPENVFSSMETIMTLVLEESEDIPPELLSSILEYLKKENKDAHPIAQRLGENVLNKCASKVRPYLVQAIRTLGVSFDDYSNVVASVCQDPSSVVESNNVNNVNINLASQVDLPNQSSEGAVEEAKETLKECASQAEASPALDKLNSTMSNGNLQKGVAEAEVVKECLTEQKSDDHIENKTAEESNKSRDEVELIVKPQPKERSNRKRGRKGNLPKSTSEPSEVTSVEQDKEAEKATDLQGTESKDIRALDCEDIAANTTAPLNSEKEADSQHPSSKTSENEGVDVASPSPSGDTPEESCLKKVGRGKKKEVVIQEATTSAENESKKESEAAAVSESGADKELVMKISSVTDKEETTPGPADASRKDDGNTSDLDTKSTKQSGKKGESVSDQRDEKKRKRQGKAISGKDLAKTPPKSDGKESDSSPKGVTKSAKNESSAASSKRKRAVGKEKASETLEYGEELVGSKIKVWWPEDKQFYEGVVGEFDPETLKHKVLYVDGDVEILYMEKEKWEFIKDDKVTDTGHGDGESPDASPEIHKKKRTKTNPDRSSKHGKSSLSAKKGVGGTSSSRSKVTASKPGSKRSDDINMEKTSKDEDSKDGVGSEGEKGGKSKDSKVGNKSVDETPKGDVETPKPGTKSKQQSGKNYSRSKGRSAKGGSGKSNAGGTGKGKVGSTSMKGKETQRAKKSPQFAKASESGKGKSSTTSSKAKSEIKSGKKRQRGSAKK